MCNVIPTHLIAKLLSQDCSERCEFCRCTFSCYVLPLSGKVVLAPYDAKVIAVLDVATNKVETVDLGSVTGSYKFSGAAAAFTF